jgi:hypothetical protein
LIAKAEGEIEDHGTYSQAEDCVRKPVGKCMKDGGSDEDRA